MDHSMCVVRLYAGPRPWQKHGIVLLLVILFAFLSAHTSYGQNYQKKNRRVYKSVYRKDRAKLAKACNIFKRRRGKKPSKPLLARNKRKSRPMAESGGSTMVARTETKPTPKPTTPAPTPVASKYPKNPKIETVSDEELETLHKNRDEVLTQNKLPVPTSETHIRVRQKVKDKIDSKENIYPLALDPLFFNFDQDEFSVVDMEPFLVAAEYALQGRTVLIEGHTDSNGQDDYNVQLSIKRVQKIRQLMLDMGVPDDRISVVGYGEEIKKYSNATSEGRQMNRRVDFTIF